MKPKMEGGKKKLICSCGYKSTSVDGGALKEKIKSSSQAIEVVHESIEVYPMTKEKCPKCGNGEAYYWHIQTRSADEPETKFLKCTKCKHTWRDYR